MEGEKIVELKDVEKWYGNVKATGPIDLAVLKGELLSLLGPSGCGKTTALRVIAGLAKLTSGTVSIKGVVVNAIPAYKRGVGMVFQNYALFPHLTVFENIAFGLRIKKCERGKISQNVESMLQMVMLPGMGQRYPHELSGGQQQRVSLARALITNPDVLLLDEPLSNLDYKLREQMRLELIRIHETFKITSVYVTHDQGEALAISDRIAVMNKGLIEQVASPREIYRNPRSTFVASFIGQSNFLEGKICKKQDQWVFVENSGLEIPLEGACWKSLEKKILLIRPESIVIGDNTGRMGTFKAKVQEVVYQGEVTYYHLIVSEKVKLIASKRSEGGGDYMKPGLVIDCQVNSSESVILEG